MTFGLAALAGALFAAGLALSGMMEPAKVTGFLDVTGGWDGTLAFVMAAAIAVYAPVWRAVRGRLRPLRAARFHLPSSTTIDGRLIAGSAIFGIGWGLSGFCPGPALASLGGGGASALVFVAAMATGIAVTRAVVGAAR